MRRSLAVVIIGIIAPLLDTTIVNVAIETLGHELHASVSTLQWVNTAYLLALGMVIPPSAWAGARFGTHRVWLFALGFFLLGSVLAGASWDIGSLIAFRVLQGIGAGLLFPLMQTIIVQAAKGRGVGQLMGLVGLPAVLVPILGPVIGGMIIDSLSWRWIFYINVPLCAVAMLAAWRLMPITPAQGRRPLDVTGLALLSPALAALLYGLSQISERAGAIAPTTILPIVAGLVLTVLFVLHTLRLLRRRGEPVMDLRPFRTPSFSAAGALLFVSGLSLYGAMLLLPLYYQQLRHQSPLHAGLLLAPQGLGSLLTRGTVGRLVDRIGPRRIVLAGVVLASAGTVPFAVAGPHDNPWALAVGLFARGAGISAANIAVMAAAYLEVPAEQVPHASSATRILQQVGGAFGTAVTAVILQHQLSGAHSSATAAFRTTFWWSVGFTAIGVFPALFLPRQKRSAQPETRPDRAGAVPR
ncbi:MDR family MFS transporter [Streptomyces achromogenes]|uniref:MDR family MFS transporter n=1 Tax=Streptomyces achromogenes TaxID=67255 RepID=UPI0036FE956E